MLTSRLPAFPIRRAHLLGEARSFSMAAPLNSVLPKIDSEKVEGWDAGGSTSLANASCPPKRLLKHTSRVPLTLHLRPGFAEGGAKRRLCSPEAFIRGGQRRCLSQTSQCPLRVPPP